MRYPDFPNYTPDMYVKHSSVYVFPAYKPDDLFSIEIMLNQDRVFSCTAYDANNKPIDMIKDDLVGHVIKHYFAGICAIIKQIKLAKITAFYDRISKKFVEFVDERGRFISPGFTSDLFAKSVELLKPMDVVVVQGNNDFDKYSNVILKPAPMTKAFGTDKLIYSRKS